MKLKLGALLILILTAFSCGKDSGDYVPSAPVNFQAPLSDPRISKLNSIGGTVTIGGYGIAGLIVYREPDGSYAAYDRCSSYQPEKKCAVVIDGSGFTVTDPCSGSKFSLADGSPVKAPASKSLRTYDAYVSNLQLFITN